jgi:cell division septum initiation protein DivIVA
VKKSIKKIFCVSCFLSTVLLFAGNKARNSFRRNSFLVPEKNFVNRSSKNELKENIGEKIKRALYTCTSISSQLGQVQREIAELQKKLLSKVESLVENKRCFKKAKRRDLSEAFDIMSDIKNELNIQETKIKQLALKMSKNKCLKS